MASCPSCACNEPPTLPPPPYEPPALPIREAFGAYGDDAEVLASLTVNMPAIGTSIATFVAMHLFFTKLYYSNALRGKMVDAPSDRFGATFGWCSGLLRVLKMPNDEFTQHCGLDAMAFIEFSTLLLKILFSFMVWACTIEIAVFYFAVQDGDNASSLSSFLARASLANLDAVPSSGNSRPSQALSLALSLLGLWLNSLYALVQINKSWLKLVGWIHSALEDPSDVVSHTLLVRATNPLAKPFSQASALSTWEGLYPGEIHSVRMVRHTGKLPELLAKLDKILAKLAGFDRRREAMIEAGKDADGAFDKRSLFGLGPSPNAQRAKLEAKLTALRLKVAAARKNHCGPENDVGLSYFVIFQASRTATIANQVVALPEASYEVSTAPVPSGVRWKALKPLAIRTRIPLRLAAKAGYWGMLFFYLPIIGFISSLLNVEELYKVFPFMRVVLQTLGPQVETFVFALMPTIVFKIFLALLPAICAFFASLHGFSSAGQVASYAYSLLFTFNVITVFLGVSIASSLLSSVYVIINDPPQILAMLSGGLANASTFFITFLLLQLVLLVNKELVRLAPTLTLFAKRRAKLIKEDEAPEEPAKFAVMWVNMMLAMCIGTCYANVAPLTTVFSFTYMLTAFVLYKRNLLYSYTHKGESRGKFFPRGVSTLCLVLGIAQLLLAAVHASKASWVTFGLTLPLIYITYRANAYFQSLFTPQMSTLPLAAVDDGKASVFRAATMAVLRGNDAYSGGGELAVKPRKSVVKTTETLAELVGSHYIQPELSHPEVCSSEHVAELIRRSSSFHGGKGNGTAALLMASDDDGMGVAALSKAKRSGKVGPAPEEETELAPPATAFLVQGEESGGARS